MLDNNERFLETAKDFLSEQEFIDKVFITSSDIAALRIVEKNQPDVILLDVLMPGQNGIELIPAMRAKAPNARIMMLSLWDLEAYRESARKAGADDFISKKTMNETLIPAIRNKCVEVLRTNEK